MPATVYPSLTQINNGVIDISEMLFSLQSSQLWSEGANDKLVISFRS